jgi:hypothetical protein
MTRACFAIVNISHHHNLCVILKRDRLCYKQVLKTCPSGRTATPNRRARHGSPQEIGEILAIGRRTVEEHVATAARKFGTLNRSHAIAIALRDKLMEL